MQDFDTDVIVAGAGPAGLMLAGELRLAGVSVVVLEQLPAPMKQSRALGFSARTLEEFAQRGLLTHFGDIGVIPVGHFGGMPLDYTVIPGGNFGVRGVPQARTEAILSAWALGLGADLRRGWKLTEIAQDEAGVEVRAETPDGVRSVRGRYVVGCDGARSTVRRLTGIDFPGYDATLEMLMADVADVQVRVRPSGELSDKGMVVVLPVGPGATRVVVFERRAEVRPRSEAPTFEEVSQAFARVTGEDISGATPLWLSYFTDASRQAAEYRRGRVFLAGDAAHIHMPIGAQGISAGVGDAMNLAWKIAADVHGHAPEGLLDTYHTERHPVGARILDNTLTQRSLYLGGPEMEPLRSVFAELMAYEDVRKLLAGMVTGLDTTYDVGVGDHPMLGRRLPDFELATPSGGSSTVYELLHTGRPLLLALADVEGLLDVAAPWTDRVDVVRSSIDDGRGPAVDAVLVRPDGYVAWVGSGTTGTDGLAEAFARWFGEPRAREEAGAPSMAGSART